MGGNTSRPVCIKQTMFLTVIVPTHRGPIEIASIIKYFISQRYPSKRLIIVENGDAIGTCKRHGLYADAVLSSAHSKSEALNVGLEWLRAKGGGPWVGWDDDDYYGPHYLDEVSDHLCKYDLVGKSSLYVKRNDGRLWLVRREGWPLGHSFAAWSDCCDFRTVNRWGEDDLFLQDMIKRGAKLGNMSPDHFVWQRSGDLSKHIWPANDEQMSQILTRDHEHSEILDFGMVSNYQFVNGARDLPPSNKVKLSKFDPLNVPGIPDTFRNLVRKLEKEQCSGKILKPSSQP